MYSDFTSIPYGRGIREVGSGNKESYEEQQEIALLYSGVVSFLFLWLGIVEGHHYKGRDKDEEV
jgi:hypothetical protein